MEDKAGLVEILKEGARQYGVELSDLQADKFITYMELLKDWNTRINLTAIEEDKEIIIKHFIDSLSVTPYIKKSGLSIIDVGTGAGFPGIPLKIVINDLKVTLLDSLDKRIKFLNEVINATELSDINAVHGRAEDFGSNPKYRERFDMSTARALASLPVLLEYCLPFVKIGGSFIAMKGNNIEELKDSRKALEILGGEIEEIKEITLPFGDMKRNIITVRKLRHSPTKYPRKAGKPSKEPLI